MTLEEIQLELEVAGVSMEHVAKLIRITKRFGFDPKDLDIKLQNWGYQKIFTIYDDPEEEKPHRPRNTPSMI